MFNFKCYFLDSEYTTIIAVARRFKDKVSQFADGRFADRSIHGDIKLVCYGNVGLGCLCKCDLKSWKYMN